MWSYSTVVSKDYHSRIFHGGAKNWRLYFSNNSADEFLCYEWYQIFVSLPCLFMKKSLNDIAFDIFALTAVVNITKICIQQHKMCNKKGCLTTSYYSTTFSRPFIQIHHLMIPSNKPLFNVPLISDKNVEFHAFQRRNNYFCTWDKPVKWMLLKNYQNSISVRRREMSTAVRLPTYFRNEMEFCTKVAAKN